MTFCKDIYTMLCEKYPNRDIYIISDHHFYHQNILAYSRNQFSSIQEMHEFIINKHNEIVKEEDIVIFLGDFCFKNKQILEILTKMHGHKYLILGNHDNKEILKNYPYLGFEGLFNLPVKLQNTYLSHEPLTNEERNDLSFLLIVEEFKKNIGTLNYHGHIHENIYIGSNYQNVACEIVDYKPLLIAKTKEIPKKDTKDLFINSKYFSKALDYLNNRYNVDFIIFLEDYIYSYILDTCKDNKDNYFIQGSFGLLKKYNYLSKMSDLDFTYLYNSNLTQSQNIKMFKKFIDDIYLILNKLERVNLSYSKRYPSLRIFEILYTSLNNHFSDCYLDANLIFLDCYKESDFLILDGNSLIEKYLKLLSSSLLEEYYFPTFQTKFLKIEGDIANLLLQIYFQKGSEEIRKVALKKLNYLYKQLPKEKEISELEDIITRLLLRNIAFLSTTSRFSEIDYLKEQIKEIPNIEAYLPEKLKNFMNEKILAKNSIFYNISEDICSTNKKDILTKCKELVRELKK